MKKIKSIVVLGIMFLLCLSAQAQWAGEDPIVVRLPDNSQKAVIGPADDTQNASYHWDGPHIFSRNHNNPQIVINPQEDGEVYTVTRVSACGEEHDEVVVSMREYPTLVSVTPLKCYNNRDFINVEDFVIITDPPGHYENMITITPSYVSHLQGAVHEIQQLTVTLDYGDYSSSKIVSVDVYNDDLATNISMEGSSLPDAYNVWRKKLLKVRDGIRQAKGITNLIKALTASLYCPCTPYLEEESGGGTFEWPMPSFTTTCCNGEPIYSFRLNSPSLSFEAGVPDCYIPLPWVSLGNWGGFYAHLSVVFGVTVGPFSIFYKGACSEVSLPVFLYGEISGGVAVMLLSKNLLSANLDLSGKAQLGFNWIINKNDVEFHPLDIELSIKGKVRAMSIFTYTVNYPLGTYQFPLD